MNSEKNRKKVLITGITGMVGSHLADYLLENTDWNIHGMCRWRSPQDNVQHLIPFVNKSEIITYLSFFYVNKSIRSLLSYWLKIHFSNY